MNIIVLIKQVPNTTDVKIDQKTGTLITEGSMINPDDKHAIEAALQLREEFGGKVTVITMGPPHAGDTLREAYGMGVDECILLSDRAFEGSDTLATSYTLATCIQKIGDYDIILCGRRAIDGDTAQTGPQVAEYLGLPQVTYVRDLRIEGDKVTAERALEDGYEIIETTLPCLLTVIKELNKPRYPSVQGIVEAYREKKVVLWTAKDIGADMNRIGLNGSPTQVKMTFAPGHKGRTEMIQGNPEEAVRILKQKLRDKNVIE